MLTSIADINSNCILRGGLSPNYTVRLFNCVMQLHMFSTILEPAILRSFDTHIFVLSVSSLYSEQPVRIWASHFLCYSTSYVFCVLHIVQPISHLGLYWDWGDHPAGLSDEPISVINHFDFSNFKFAKCDSRSWSTNVQYLVFINYSKLKYLLGFYQQFYVHCLQST